MKTVTNKVNPHHATIAPALGSMFQFENDPKLQDDIVLVCKKVVNPVASEFRAWRYKSDIMWIATLASAVESGKIQIEELMRNEKR